MQLVSHSNPPINKIKLASYYHINLSYFESTFFINFYDQTDIMQYDFLEIEYQQQIDMKQQTNIPNPQKTIRSNYISCIGIFQVLKVGKLVQYGLGVLIRRDQSLITLSKYFLNDQKPGRIFFFKQNLTQGNRLPRRIDFNKNLVHQYDVYTSASVEQIQANRLFAKIKLSEANKLNERLDSQVCTVSYKDFQRVSDCGRSAIGLINRSQDLFIYAEEYDADRTLNLSFPFKAAALFFFDKKSKHQEILRLGYLYGFFENFEQREKGEDYYMYSDMLIHPSLRGGGYICMANILPTYVKDHEFIYPYKSIGILENGVTKGTAGFLYDKKQKSCKFLITCAHNFERQIQKNGLEIIKNIAQIGHYPQKLEEIKFFLKGPIPEKPNRTGMIELDGFQIQSVYIPTQYVEKEQFISTRFQGKQYKNKLILKRNKFFDIAIIQLKKPIELHQGFRIRSSEKSFEDIVIKNIELSGFPGDNAQAQTLHPNMYKDTMKNHMSYTFQFGQAKGKKWRIIKHKLSTLGGNSGSPIYELSQTGQCHLIGVHIAGIPFKDQSQQYTYGVDNLATYLYSEHIQSWLMTVPGIQSVLDQ